jgi:hypothetical protein
VIQSVLFFMAVANHTAFQTHPRFDRLRSYLNCLGH